MFARWQTKATPRQRILANDLEFQQECLFRLEPFRVEEQLDSFHTPLQFEGRLLWRRPQDRVQLAGPILESAKPRPREVDRMIPQIEHHQLHAFLWEDCSTSCL